jgi:putative hydrolase of HD superfamily
MGVTCKEIALFELDSAFEFLNEIEKLKTVTRGNKTLDGRQENSAEHSWHVSLMAILLSNYASTEIDLLKTVKMLLIHDIVEIDAGDTWLYNEEFAEKLHTEELAADRIFDMLPKELAFEYRSLWEEFEARQSNEAKFASAIDGLQPLLNHVVTGSASDGTIPVELVRERKEYIKEFAPQLWYKVEQVINESVAKGLYV